MESPKRWEHVNKLLTRKGPFAHPDFEPSEEILPFLKENCRILVVGAGGLGCELLKDLALMGFFNIDVIDMDTIDISNLNRQFLFRQKDVGQPKATVAAEVINRRIPGCNVTPHYKRIEDYDADFYSQFHILVCGLDSISARRWLNGMAISLLEYDDDGNIDQSSVKFIVDGGTEGFKGNARVILPGISACIECTLDLFPPQVTFPLCTIAHTPRLPEHCIEYIRLLAWNSDNPFGKEISIDGDNPDHINWIYEKASERALEYGITGVTYRLTQGVVKHIIPAVASTNAVIAAACSMEVFKIATSCGHYLNNYMNFNDTDGIYTYTFEYEKKDDCLACSNRPKVHKISKSATLKSFRKELIESYQMKSPALTTRINDKNKTLYMETIQSIEEKTRPNLEKSLEELSIQHDQEIVVADMTSPNALTFRIHFTDDANSK